MSEWRQLSASGRAELNYLKDLKRRTQLNPRDPDYVDADEGLDEAIEKIENGCEV
jgi:hypothetical protein